MKILIVPSKPAAKEFILQHLNSKQNLKHAYCFETIKKHVCHLDSYYSKIRKEGDNYYNIEDEKKVNVCSLKLKNFNIPKDTYLIYNSSLKPEYENYDEFDLIIGVCDPDELGILEFKKFIEDRNIKNAKFVKLLTYTSDTIDKIMDLESIENFDDIFFETYKKMVDENFESVYKKEFDIFAIRKKTGMSRTDFAKYFEIPYRTIENWENGTNKCPSYLYKLIEFKLKTKGII